MRLTHKIVAVIGCAALAGAVQAGVKNGHFENRGSGNIYWQTCSVWTPSEVIIPNSGGNPCSYLHIKTPSCGEGRQAWQGNICVIPPGPAAGFATLKFQAKASHPFGITVTFSLGSGGTTTREIPPSSSTAWATHSVSLPVFGPTDAKVLYSVCGAGPGAFLQVDNVSVCFTTTNQTTLGPPTATPCDCSAACSGVPVEVKTGGPTLCIGQDSCVCNTPNAPVDDPPAAPAKSVTDQVIDALAAWGSCDGCPQDVSPMGAADGQVDLNDLIEILSSGQSE